MRRKKSWEKLIFFLLFGVEKKYKEKNNTFLINLFFFHLKIEKIDSLKLFK